MTIRSEETRNFAINSYSYTIDHTAVQFLDKLADRGHRIFELMVYPGHLWPKELPSAARTELRRHIETRGLEVVTLNMPNIDINIAAASEEMRTYTLDLLEGIITLAGELGVPGVIIGPGKANPLFAMPRERLMGHFFRALDRLVPVAQGAGTNLYIENMPFAFLPAIDELLEALERYGNDDLGVVYDVANAWFIHEDIPDGLRKSAQRLRLVHYSDTGHGAYRHDAVGLGTVPFAIVPPVLEEIGHRAPPMLEIIAPEPDRAIDDSIERLLALGYDRPRAS